MKISISLVFTLLMTVNVSATDESDCAGRSRLAFEIASLRDNGSSIDTVFSIYKQRNIHGRTLHNIVNSVYQFPSYSPAKLSTLEKKACEMALDGKKAKWEWRSISGTYDTGEKYSGASIAQEDGALFLIFESDIAKLAFSLAGYKNDSNVEIIIDGVSAFSGIAQPSGEGIFTLFYANPLVEPTRSFIISLANCETIEVKTSSRLYKFSAIGVKDSVIGALKASGLVN